jgi:hypothetical protein
MKLPELYSHKLCTLCQRHHAKFTFRGRVKRDKDHDVCHRCYRSLRDKNRARSILLIRPYSIFPCEGTSFFRQALGKATLKMPTQALGAPTLEFQQKEQRKCH